MKFFRFLKKLWDYAPLLWHDKDWDYGFLLEMIKFKMNRMADCIESNEIIEANKAVAKQIRYGTYLLDRYMGDEDFDRFHKEHKDKWGEAKTEFIKEGRLYKMETSWEKADTPEKHNQAQLEYHDMVMKIYAKEEEMLDRFFKHTRKYVTRWWD